MKIVPPSKFPWRWFRGLSVQKRAPGNPKTKSKVKYLDIVTAFDIETTRIEEIEQSVMYVWQWCFSDVVCVVGRTWGEFLDFVEMLGLALPKGATLCTFVHNLSFEFFFLRGVLRFETDNVFAIKERKILKAVYEHLEFRCSYLHSNMSLKDYLKKMGTAHQKLPDYEYTAKRFSWTELTETELEYCVNDVIGLVEAITIEMAADGDNLYTFPLTSTGYVRRDAKRAMRQVSHGYVQGQLPDYATFKKLREAFRGGDTHASRHFAGQTVHNGHSADRSSSYPDDVCNDLFPVSQFYTEPEPLSLEDVVKLIEVRKRAVLMCVAICGLELRESDWPCPYLSTDKCRNIMPMTFPDGVTIPVTPDNGRLLEAGYLETTITDVDLKILLREYKWRDIVFYEVSHARYGPLPAPLIKTAIDYYKAKTALKNVPGQGVYYTKSKNKLNSIYGMMAQNPAKLLIQYFQDGAIDPKTGELKYFLEDTSKSEAAVLEDNKKRLFLCYQWGVWVTAWARYRLHEGIWTVIDQGAEFLYCDTDSIKYLGFVDWTAYNTARIKASKKSGAFADDPQGITHYMGVFEIEDDMAAFRTWGAKKYVYTTIDKNGLEVLHSTVAGVGKTAGARELQRAGIQMRQLGMVPWVLSDAAAGVEAFRLGFVFVEAGGLEAVYNDRPELSEYEIDGHKVAITPNVNLRPSTYTLGLAGDYERLLRSRVYIDIDI